MTKAIRRSIKIPFSGFYESSHNAEIDHAIESFFDREGNGENHVPENFYFSFEHFSDIRLAYARRYAEDFATWFTDETGLPLPITFEELRSPREYNFETDRIFVSVPLAALKKIRAFVTDETLAAHIKESCTSYNGFCSFYSNELKDWKAKPFATWDHNELGILIEAALIQAGAAKPGYEYEVMEYALCNGIIDTIVDPYLNEWVGKNPLDAAEQKIKEAFNIPDSQWDALLSDEKEDYLNRFEALPARCDKTPDLFAAV